MTAVSPSGSPWPRDTFVAAADADSLPADLMLDRVRRRMFDVDPAPIRLGRLQLLEVVGRGASGAVYAAYDPSLERKVAVKLFPRDAHRELAPRIRREARVAASLNHPNIVPVYDFGEDDGRFWFAMAFIEGRTLRHALQAVPRRWPDLAPYFLSAASGVEAAHRRGIVHGDIKPENILVGTDGRVYVSDFGLATVRGQAEAISGGTPAYMAPEQLQGDAASAATDQFALCVTLFEALVGERPFAGGDADEMLAKMRRGPSVSLAAAGLPRSVQRALARGLSFAPEDRFASMGELGDALSVRPWTRRVAPIVAGAAVVGGGIVAARQPEDTCALGETRVAQVWDDGQRAKLAQSLGQAGNPVARDAWARIEPALDQYSASWVATHRQVCEAFARDERDDFVLDRQMLCLDLRAQELGATIHALREPEPETIDNATELVGGLASSLSCLEPHRAGAEASSPNAFELSEALVDARIALRSGRADRAAALAGQVASDALQKDQPWLRAQALGLLGKAENERGNKEQAADVLEQAFFLGLTQGDAQTQIHAALDLATFHSMYRHDPKAAQMWLSHAKAQVARADVSPQLQAAVLDREGSVLSSEGEGEAAAELFLEAYALLEAHDSLTTVHGARLLQNMASLATVQQRFEDAERNLREVVDIRERLLGASHPDYARAQAALGTTLGKRGHVEEAERLLGQALEVLSQSIGVEHESYADVENSLAASLLGRGEVDQARPLLEHAVSVFEKTPGSAHPHVIAPLANLALIHSSQGRLQEAVVIFERLVVLTEALGSPPHMRLGVFQNLGATLVQLGDWDAAVGPLERAVGLARSTSGRNSLVLSAALANLASVHAGRTHHQDAEALYREAIELEAEALPARDPRRLVALLGLAASAHAQGRLEPAIEALEIANALEHGANSDPVHIAQVEFGLAEVLLDARGDAARIMSLARSARARIEAAPPQRVAGIKPGYEVLFKRCQRYAQKGRGGS